MDFNKARYNMVEQQIRPWDVLAYNILDALSDIPREVFVTESQKSYAYSDKTLPLPNGGSMLEPKIVARLIQGLDIKPGEKVLEVGTGSGYAAALMAQMGAHIVTIDIDPEQQMRAKLALDALEFDKITYQVGDGLAAEAGGAPFDLIYIGGGVSAAPELLKEQLKDGRRMVVIVGGAPVQRAQLIVRNGNTFIERTLFDTLIPMLTNGGKSAPSKFNF